MRATSHRLAIAALALAALFTTTGCTKPPRPPQPPIVVFNETTCDYCTMNVHDRLFVAARTSSDGSPDVVYDDISCLIADLRSTPLDAAQQAWVVDATTGAWLKAEAAFYMRSPKLKTPMLSGLAAYTTAPAADTAAKLHEGATLDWTQVQAWRKPDDDPL